MNYWDHPCYFCTDEKKCLPDCQQNCKKPDFVKFKKEQIVNGYTSEQIKKRNKFKRNHEKK